MRSIRTMLYLGLSFSCAIEASAAIQLQTVTTAVTSPTLVTPAGDGSHRLFIVEQGGFIRVLQPGSSTPTQFLDVHTLITVAGNEQGLLGLAFHPKYAINGRFFIYYTRSSDGALRIAEYHVSAGNPNVADTIETPLLTIPHPGQQNHNGGNLAFGPDGYLYMGCGDGGSGNDPPNNAQNINALLGKMLRIDVDTPNGPIPYSSPPSNPFFGPTAGADEIFAFGLRNPWRWSFDRGGTHQLYLGDVGQDAWEEIDIITLGGNYGWRVYEGFHCTGNDAGLCTPTNYISPIAEYAQSARCSITGGYIYRGYRSTFPAGVYVYADYCTGEIFQLSPPTTGGAQTLLLDAPNNLTSFGQDEAGDLFVCLRSGKISRLVTNPAPATCTYSLTTSSQSFGSAGGSNSLTINAAADCGWAVASHASWITVNLSPLFGTGTTAIGYTVAGNNGPARSGTIQVAGQTFTVNQAAVASPIAWRSLRSHGGDGNLSILLNPTATGNGSGGPTVETRIGGIRRIEVDFDSPIALADTNAVQVTGYTTSNGILGGGINYIPASVSTIDADTLAITFPTPPNAGALPDMSCYIIELLPTLTAEGLTGDRTVAIRTLEGDTTMDGLVGLSDALCTQALALASVAASASPQHDLDTSGGTVALADAIEAKSRVDTPARSALCP